MGAAADVGAQADHRQEDPRLHAARLRDRARRRPIAATCSCACRATRSSARSSPSRRCSQEFRITPGAVPRGRAQAVREEVRPAGRRRRELQHGGHDPGLRARARDPRSASSRRPTGRRCAARRCCRSLHGGNGDGDGCGSGCRSHAIPEGQARAHAADADRDVRRDVPRRATATTSRPTPLCVARRHGRRQRRHRVEVRRAPRDAALHSRELHAVHGVHRGLSGHGAAQLLAGSRNGPADGGHQLRDRSPASVRRCSARCRRSKSARAS